MIRVCPITHFLNKSTNLCEPCSGGPDYGTVQFQQTECMTCGIMRDETISNGDQASLQNAVANQLCSTEYFTEYDRLKIEEVNWREAEKKRIAAELAAKQEADRLKKI